MPLQPQSEIRRRKPEIILLLICAVAFALRLGLLFDNRFHPDEALFSTWALKIAQGGDFLLSGVPVDKPPLLIYLSALSFFIFGQSELAARVPNLIASVVSVVLVWRLGLSQMGTGNLELGKLSASPLADASTKYQSTNYPFTDLLPPLLFALSPFAILFAPTAFLDPMMVMLGLASLVAVSRGRAGWAGILLGLSFATKVQGLFFMPLIPVFWRKQVDRETSPSVSLSLYPSIKFVMGFALIAACVLLWDRARGGLPFWVQQTINYGGIRVIYPSELSPRLTGWLDFLPYFFGPMVGLLGLIGLPILLYDDLALEARTHAAWIDLWLLAYTIGFFALHWFLAFPVWDRYFLILVPIIALLLGRSLQHVIMSRVACRLVTKFARLSISPSLPLFIICLAALPFGLVAARSGYPIGGDHGANDGIDQVAAYLKVLPSGTVVYDHWLAWELDYYLGDGFAYLAYFDTPAALADDVHVFGGHDNRYVIFPARESPAKVIDAIGQIGYTLKPVFTTLDRFGQTSFTIYQIVKCET